MALQVKFGRASTVPATLENGRKESVTTAGGFRPYEGGVGGTVIDLDAPSKAQHALKADLSAVLQLANVNQSADGEKTFLKVVSASPAPTANQHLTNKLYVDTGINGLQTQITTLNTNLASAMKTAVPIDCSTNPNYPAVSAGWQGRVTVAGRIGGAAGAIVQRGDLIVCFVTSSGGTEAAVGEAGTTPNFYVLQGNADQATDTVLGLVMRALPAAVVTGSDNVKYVTALGVETAIDAKSLRFDKAQALTAPQKAQALANLGAMAAADAVPSTRTLTAGNGLTGGGSLAADRSFALDEAYVTARYLSLTSPQPVTGGPITINRGGSATAADLLIFRTPDYGPGNPRLAIAKTNVANKYNFSLWDGSSSNGTINYVAQNLTHNDIPIINQTMLDAALASQTLQYVADTWT